jgi:hypothetical protein
MADVECTFMAPVRELLSEGKSGELVVRDPTDTTLALIGAVDRRHGAHGDQHLRPRRRRRTP